MWMMMNFNNYRYEKFSFYIGWILFLVGLFILFGLYSLYFGDVLYCDPGSNSQIFELDGNPIFELDGKPIYQPYSLGLNYVNQSYFITGNVMYNPASSELFLECEANGDKGCVGYIAASSLNDTMWDINSYGSTPSVIRLRDARTAGWIEGFLSGGGFDYNKNVKSKKGLIDKIRTGYKIISSKSDKIGFNTSRSYSNIDNRNRNHIMEDIYRIRRREARAEVRRLNEMFRR